MNMEYVCLSIKYFLLLHCSCEGKWQRWRATTIGSTMNEASSLKKTTENQQFSVVF